MTPIVAQVTHDQIATLQMTLAAFGPLQTIAFKRVESNGVDIYSVSFPTGVHEFRILQNANGLMEPLATTNE